MMLRSIVPLILSTSAVMIGAEMATPDGARPHTLSLAEATSIYGGVNYRDCKEITDCTPTKVENCRHYDGNPVGCSGATHKEALAGNKEDCSLFSATLKCDDAAKGNYDCAKKWSCTYDMMTGFCNKWTANPQGDPNDGHTGTVRAPVQCLEEPMKTPP